MAHGSELRRFFLKSNTVFPEFVTVAFAAAAKPGRVIYRHVIQTGFCDGADAMTSGKRRLWRVAAGTDMEEVEKNQAGASVTWFTPGVGPGTRTQ